jgi:phage-related protein
MEWTVTYYNSKIESDFLTWPDKLLAKYLRIVDMITIHGPDLGMPHTKAMGNGLFEIRAKAQEGIGRAFFCTIMDKEVVILHGFIKKTDKTPTKEVRIANKRLQEIKK